MRAASLVVARARRSFHRHHHVLGQRHVGQLQDALRFPDQAWIGEGLSDRDAGGEQERIRDAAADDQAVDLVRQLGEHAELGRDLGAADDRDQRPRRFCQCFA